MNIITLDFETFFSDDYMLKKMTTEAYIRDPRFEVHGVACRWYNGIESITEWYTAERFKEYIAPKTVWARAAILCHHAQFDGLILSHHYGVQPHVWLDTLSMARLMLGNHISVSLDSLARHFNLSAKNVPYDLFKGKHWHELTVQEQKLVANGCCHDVELTWQIFNKLMTGDC